MVELENELKQLIVQVLSLRDVTPEQIDTEAPLIGDGLGLDSLDALELAIEIGKRYAVKFPSGDTRVKSAFASVRVLAGYITDQRVTPDLARTA
jgi:acyl carrier protein